MIALLAINSMVFYGATTKYLKVFEPALVYTCSDFLRNARALVRLPQILAIFLFAFGGEKFATFVCLLVLSSSYAIIFCAVIFPLSQNQ